MTPGHPRAPTRLLLASAAVLAATVVMVARHHQRARDVWHALAGLPPPALGGALLLVLCQLAFQASRLWALVPPAAELPFWRVARAFVLGEWTNIVAPARAGDAFKVVLLTRAAPGPPPLSLPAATGAVLADKIVDAGAFVVLTIAAARWTGVAATLPRVPLPGPLALVLFAGLGTLVALGLRLTRSRWFARLARWRRELVTGLSVLGHPRQLVPSAGASLAAWIAEALALRLLTGALGIPVPLPHLILALAALNVGISVPVTAGNLGVYEAILTLGLSRAGVPLPAAVALATLHHALELLATNLAAAALSLAGARREPARARAATEG